MKEIGYVMVILCIGLLCMIVGCEDEVQVAPQISHPEVSVEEGMKMVVELHERMIGNLNEINEVFKQIRRKF